MKKSWPNRFRNFFSISPTPTPSNQPQTTNKQSSSPNQPQPTNNKKKEYIYLTEEDAKELDMELRSGQVDPTLKILGEVDNRYVLRLVQNGTNYLVVPVLGEEKYVDEQGNDVRSVGIAFPEFIGKKIFEKKLPGYTINIVDMNDGSYNVTLHRDLYEPKVAIVYHYDMMAGGKKKTKKSKKGKKKSKKSKGKKSKKSKGKKKSKKSKH